MYLCSRRSTKQPLILARALRCDLLHLGAMMEMQVATQKTVGAIGKVGNVCLPWKDCQLLDQNLRVSRVHKGILSRPLSNSQREVL